MNRSTDRILTTHAGSLPRPLELVELYQQHATGEALDSAITAAVSDVVRKQVEVGIDIVNDGEFGKPVTDEIDFNPWYTYIFQRLGGFDVKPVPIQNWALGKDQKDFADFYATEAGENFGEDGDLMHDDGVCVGPIEYAGYDLAENDVDRIKSAVKAQALGQQPILMAIAPGFMLEKGEYYATLEEELDATADALRQEYKTITDAGVAVQIDDPLLVCVYEWAYSETGDVKTFRKWAEGHIERVNRSLEGIPEELVRYHVCWGSWKGPHTADLPLEDVADLIVKVNAAQYSIEAANGRHEHEWTVWRDVKLPEGRSVVPGVVSHKTNVVEHPELVAQRLMRFAEVVGRDNVIAGTDCGMGGRLHPQLVWAKLQALSDGAAIASERLWHPERG